MKRTDLCRWCKRKLTKVYSDNCCSERCYEKAHQARLRYSQNINKHLKKIGGKMAQQIITKEMVKQIAKEYGKTKGGQELAIEMGVTRQRIQQIVKKLKERGADIPSMQIKTLVINRAVNDAVVDLKKEIPILFEKD